MVKKLSRIALVLTHFALAAALLTATSCSLLSPRDYDQYRLSESSTLDSHFAGLTRL
ncbi:MAG: hypothetical protein WCI05_14055 [Myxococcales bacterium]